MKHGTDETEVIRWLVEMDWWMEIDRQIWLATLETETALGREP